MTGGDESIRDSTSKNHLRQSHGAGQQVQKLNLQFLEDDHSMQFIVGYKDEIYDLHNDNKHCLGYEIELLWCSL